MFTDSFIFETRTAISGVDFTTSHLQRVKRMQRNSACKRMFVVTELFNTDANDFDAKKFARYKRNPVH